MDIKTNELSSKHYTPKLAVGERRVRTIFTDHQVEGLERAFEHNKYPDYQMISDKFNINIGRVKIWFQNKRARQPNKNGDSTKHTPKYHKKNSPKLIIKPKPTFKLKDQVPVKTSPNTSPKYSPGRNIQQSVPSNVPQYASTLYTPTLHNYSPVQYSTVSDVSYQSYYTPPYPTIQDVTNHSSSTFHNTNSNYPFTSPTNFASSPTAPTFESECSSSTSGCSSGSSGSEDESTGGYSFSDATNLQHQANVALDLRSEVSKNRKEDSPKSVIQSPAQIFMPVVCDNTTSYSARSNVVDNKCMQSSCTTLLNLSQKPKIWSPITASTKRTLPTIQPYLPAMYQKTQLANQIGESKPSMFPFINEHLCYTSTPFSASTTARL